MPNWKKWRIAVIGISSVTALILLGAGSSFNIELSTEILSGITIQSVLGVLNGISVYGLVKML